MSAGKFEFGRYSSNAGDIYTVRVQEETKQFALGALTNTYPTGTATMPGVYPLNLGGRRRKPFSARTVSVRFSATPPTGYAANSILRVPIFRPEFYDAIAVGATNATYLGVAVEVVGKSAEAGL